MRVDFSVPVGFREIFLHLMVFATPQVDHWEKC